MGQLDSILSRLTLADKEGIRILWWNPSGTINTDTAVFV